MDIEKLKDWRDGARRGLGREVDHLREKEEQLSGYIQVLDATEELVAEIDNLNEELERRQSEIDDLSEQLEQKEAELYALRQQLQGEIDALRSQLLDVKERAKTRGREEVETDGDSQPLRARQQFAGV